MAVTTNSDILNDILNKRAIANKQMVDAANARGFNTNFRPAQNLYNGPRFMGGSYQQMLQDTSPRVKPIEDMAEDLAQKITKVKNGTGPKTIVQKARPKIQLTATKSVSVPTAKSALKTTSKFAGKAAPVAGAAITAADIFRTNQIANDMEEVNKINPGTYPEQAIQYYRNKAKALSWSAGIGGGIGGIVGGVGGAALGGVGAIPGAGAGMLAGSGYGAAAGELLNALLSKDNPYREYKFRDEDKKLLKRNENLSKAEAEEVGDATKDIKSGKVNIEGKQPAITKTGSSTVLRDANGNVILPNLPGTAIAGDLPDISTATGNTANSLSEDGIEDINAQSGISTSSDLDKLLEAYERRLSVNQPYMNALWQYIENYPEMQRAAMNRDKWLTGVSILSGSPEFKNMIGKYNPADIEATRLDLLNKLLQTKANELSGMDELIGRAALTKTGNLPIEAALADKDTFKAMSPILSSINALKGRTYTTDINNQTKLQIAKMNLEGMLYRAKMNNDAAAQRVIANQLGNVNRALITSMGFNGVSPVGLADVYNQMGYGKLDTSNLQGADIQEVMNNLGL